MTYRHKSSMLRSEEAVLKFTEKVLLEIDTLTQKTITGLIDKAKSAKNKNRYRKALENLKNSGVIKIQDEKISLTDKGTRQVLQTKAIILRSPNKKDWDNKWRLISYDIPEEMRQGRDSLRRLIKRIGFVQLQKSLWVHPSDCLPALNSIVVIYGMQDYVSLIETSKLSNDANVKRHFRL